MALAPRYGRAAVPEMWIVDVDAAAVTVHTDPGADEYATRRVLRRGDEVAAASLAGLSRSTRFSASDLAAMFGNDQRSVGVEFVRPPETAWDARMHR